MTSPFPSLYEYAMARECPSCTAPSGVVCNAPNKSRQLARVDGIRAELGLDQVEHDPIARLHKTRQQAGARHRRCDIRKRHNTLPTEAR
ncbi:hypothetical protein ACWGNN_25325 [Streptomyces sp. NPDC055817]